MTEMHGLYEFLTKGIDDEDIVYLKESYEAFLQDPNASYWLNDTHWVDHPDILYCFASIVVVICAGSLKYHLSGLKKTFKRNGCQGFPLSVLFVCVLNK